MSTLRKLLALGTTLSLSLTLAACSGGADSGASGNAGGDSDNTLTVWAWEAAPTQAHPATPGATPTTL